MPLFVQSICIPRLKDYLLRYRSQCTPFSKSLPFLPHRHTLCGAYRRVRVYRILVCVCAAKWLIYFVRCERSGQRNEEITKARSKGLRLLIRCRCHALADTHLPILGAGQHRIRTRLHRISGCHRPSVLLPFRLPFFRCRAFNESFWRTSFPIDYYIY